MRRAPAHIRPRTLGSRSSWGQQLHRRRFLGSSSSPSSAAVCFDIDGVLLKGKVLLPGARESLRRLHDSKVPFIFVTNGGGCTEAEKAAELSRKFDLEIPRSMVLLSHSPMRKLAERYKSKRVLVLGNRCQEIAQEDLGLHNTVTVPEIAGTWPGMYHFGGSTFYTQKIFPAPGDGMSSSPVEAIMVVHDPLDWHLEIQVVLDVLRGGSPPGTGTGARDGRHTPMFISNPDFIFASNYPQPRLAAGAFADCVKMLYEKQYGAQCHITQFGKPTSATFSFAETMLQQRCKALGHSPDLNKIFMIGDNPSGDVRGANMAGRPWISSLVRTGVFSGPPGSNDPIDAADYVFDNVEGCVDFIFESM